MLSTENEGKRGNGRVRVEDLLEPGGCLREAVHFHFDDCEGEHERFTRRNGLIDIATETIRS